MVNNLSLDILPSASDVFIDSNIFTYHLLGHKKYRDSVKRFLLKVESGIYKGYLNEVVVSEVYHNFLRVKICEKYNLIPQEFVKFMKSNHKVIYEINMDLVTALLSMKNLELLHDIRVNMVEKNMTQYHLLSADAVHVASCCLHGIKNIATNDSDFERVAFLNLWIP